jgi:hypothetical protein
MPRLPHRKYASLLRRWEEARSKEARLARELKELLEGVRPPAIPQEHWELAVGEATTGENYESHFPNSLSNAMLDVGERAER